MKDHEGLLRTTQRDIERLERHERSRPGLLGLTLYGGTLGLLFVVPIVAGAYVGRWLDDKLSGYSVRWTISLIILGIAVGGYNGYRFIRGKV